MTATRYERRWEGQKYAASKGLPLKDVAALIRRDLAAEVQAGRLPDEFKYRVRTSRGTAVDVFIVVPDGLEALAVEFATTNWNGPSVTSSYAYDNLFVGVYEPLKGLLDAYNAVNAIRTAYNYDASDAMTDYFDVRFYGGVRWVSQADYDKFYK